MTAPDDDAEDDPRPVVEERAVLGRMLLSRTAVGQVATLLRPEHFSVPAHRDVFETIIELFERDAPTDEVAVAAALSGDRLVRVGGILKLHALTEDISTAVNIGYYADLLRDRVRRAEVADALSRATHLIRRGDAAATAQNLAAIRELVDQATDDRDPDTARDGVWVHESIEQEVQAWEEPTQQGLLTGYSDFDELTGGLRGGQMIIVAARPSIGKSTVGCDWARHIAEHGGATLIVSLEMSRRDLMQRMIAAKAKVRLSDIRQRSWTEYEHGQMTAAARALREVAIRIEDGSEITMTDIRSRARAMARSATGLKFLVLDYLQLLSSGRKVENRQQEVSEFSRALKVLAKELDIPVVAISQLNRGPEQRTDHRPMLSDLRESGSLEQDADLVVLLNRPDAWERDDPRAGEADLILAKHRNGPTATITMAHQLHYARFADLARGPGV